MNNAALLVWLEAVPQDERVPRVGMLCRRHADAMVVPRGWTLDDRRETTPRLFKVSAALDARDSSTGARRSKPRPVGDQLHFDVDSAQPSPSDPEPVTVADLQPRAIDPDETRAMPWRFAYDAADNLGGVLDARGPLLSRAFSGARRASGASTTQIEAPPAGLVSDQQS